LAERYRHFIETGTGRGTSLTFALNYPFRTLHSIDVDLMMHTRAQKIFAGERRLTLHNGLSVDVLPELLRRLPVDEPVVWWLDAHNPGCWYGWSALATEKDVRLPLELELRIIREMRGGAPDDLILIDDARIYLNGEFEHGNLSYCHHTLAPEDRNIDFITGMFGATHALRLDYADDGYLILAPIGRAESLHKPLIRELVDTARALIETNSREEAKSIYQRILEITDPPSSGVDKIARGEAASFMAREALAQERNGTALDWLQEAILADPECVEYRYDLISRALIPMGWYSFAETEALRTVQLFPDSPFAWRAHANVQRELCHEEEARGACDKLLQIDPNGPEALRSVAALEVELANFDAALDIYRRLIDLAPRSKADRLVDIGICRDRQGHHEEALSIFDEAAALDSTTDKPLLHWNRGWTLLTLGHYAEGWKEVEERKGLRTVLPGLGMVARRFRRPSWTRDVAPGRVHIHGEQGFGDVLQLSRWAPLVRDLGHDVRLEVASPLVDLFDDSFAGIKVVRRSIDYPGTRGIEDFDYHIPMMGLPAAFDCTIDNIPWDGPYLKADPARVAAARQLSDQDPERKRIGLCWSSGERVGLWLKEYAKRKSIAMEQRAGLFARDIGEQVTWHEFDFERRPQTFAETAAQLARLDLLITVDTAIGHLAGAMGVPTWLLMHCNGSWHYMAAGRDARWEKRSPWYPSLTLYRQSRPHEWEPVLKQVAADLRAFL
jgi:tetratricopeptide (TPR) repeat protein